MLSDTRIAGSDGILSWSSSHCPELLHEDDYAFIADCRMSFLGWCAGEWLAGASNHVDKSSIVSAHPCKEEKINRD